MTQSMPTALLPCPFCSCRNVEGEEVLMFTIRDGQKFIKCTNCGAKGGHAPLSPKGTQVDVEFQEAADAWNAQACYVLATLESDTRQSHSATTESELSTNSVSENEGDVGVTQATGDDVERVARTDWDALHTASDRRSPIHLPEFVRRAWR